MTLRQGTKRKQLLDFEETRRYSALMQEVLDHTLWKRRFGRGYGPVVNKLRTEWMNE